MPSAVVQFDFDPVIRLGDRLVRLETIGIALAILVGLVVAGIVAGRTPAGRHAPGRASPVPGNPAGEIPGPSRNPPSATGSDALPDAAASADADATLRRDDLLFIALGILPGAILGGRLGWALGSADFVLGRPAVLIDPAVGALTLGGAVLGGTLTGIYVAALLEAPVGRWLDALIGPLLLALALGKLSMGLGGSGQGVAFGGPWATQYGGLGPWGSVEPGVPAHPAQVYEAMVDLAVLSVVILLAWTPLFARHPDGRLFWTGIGLWALGRSLVASVWRDPPLWGDLNAEQMIGLATAILAASFIVILALRSWLRGRRAGRASRSDGLAGRTAA